MKHSTVPWLAVLALILCLAAAIAAQHHLDQEQSRVPAGYHGCILPGSDGPTGQPLPARPICLNTGKPATEYDLTHPCYSDGMGGYGGVAGDPTKSMRYPCGTFVPDW